MACRDPDRSTSSADTFILRNVCNELGTVKYKWFEIGIQLGIPRYKLEEFKKKDDPLSAIIDFFLRGNVADVARDWTSVVTALKSPHVGEPGLAKRIQQKYQQGSTVEQDPSDRLYAESAVSSSQTSSGSSSDLPAIDLAPYFPYLTTDGSMSKEELNYYRLKLDEETTRIKRSFADLVSGLQDHIEKAHKVDAVVNYLKFLEPKYDECLQDCDDVIKIFSRLYKHFSFFDFNLIKALTSKFGSGKCKKKLKVYKKKFQEYSKRRLCECPIDAFSEMKSEDKSSCYILKIEGRMREYKVEELKCLQYKMNEILGQKFLKLVDVDEGCIELAFQGSSEIHLELTEERQQKLRDLEVLLISYGSRQYDLKMLQPKFAKPGKISGDSAYGSSDTKTTAPSTRTSDPLDVVSDHITKPQERDLSDLRDDMISSADIYRKAQPSFSPLCMATLDNNLEKVKFLIKKGANPLDKDVNGDTVLHLAVLCDKFDILKYLIEDVGCNPGSEGWYGSTTLHSAAGKSLHVVKYLIEQCQLDPSALDNLNCTPLIYACRAGHLDIVKYLIECMSEYMSLESILYCDSSVNKQAVPHSKTGIFPGVTLPGDMKASPLTCACITGRLDIVKYLIEKHYCNLCLTKDDMIAPLESAIFGGCLFVLLYLLNTKCVPTPSSTNDWNPLHIAILKGDMCMIQFLMPKWRHAGGISPVHLAVCFGKLTVVKYFLSGDCKFNPNEKGPFGRQLVHFAAEYGYLDIIKYLIEKCSCGAGALDNDGVTPLYLAAGKGHLSVVRYLTVKHNCSPSYINGKFGTSVDHAKAEGHNVIVRFFAQNFKVYPNVNGKPGMCNTPTHMQQLLMELSSKQLSQHICDEYHEQPSVLCRAVVNGNLYLVKYLIETGKWDPNCTDSDRCKLVHFSAFFGHLHILQYLIGELKMDKNSVNDGGQTPLTVAGMNGHNPIISYLLKIGSKHQDSNGITPLHGAAEAGKLDTVKYLMITETSMYHSNTTVSPLHCAIAKGRLDVIKYLLEVEHCDPHILDEDGRTLMHHAVMFRQLSVAHYLIHNVSVDHLSTNNFNLSPLHLAIKYGYIEMVRLLITELHCDPNISDDKQYKPIHLAAASGRLDILKYFVEELKCDCNSRAMQNLTALHIAAYHNHLSIVQYLVNKKNGVAIFCRSNSGYTPLHTAAMKNNLEIAKFLVNSFPLYLLATTDSNETPLHIALQSCSAATALYLIVAIFKSKLLI